MKAVNLGSGPYHFKSILSCRIEKTVNSHFRAEVSGYTADSVEEALRISEQKEPFVIYAEEEGEKVGERHSFQEVKRVPRFHASDASNSFAF